MATLGPHRGKEGEGQTLQATTVLFLCLSGQTVWAFSDVSFLSDIVTLNLVTALCFFLSQQMHTTYFAHSTQAKRNHCTCVLLPAPTNKNEKLQHSARSEEGRLFYDGEWYGRGQNICIDKKDEYPTR